MVHLWLVPKGMTAVGRAVTFCRGGCPEIAVDGYASPIRVHAGDDACHLHFPSVLRRVRRQGPSGWISSNSLIVNTSGRQGRFYCVSGARTVSPLHLS